MRFWLNRLVLKLFIFLEAVLRAGSLGIPDLGITTLQDVLIDGSHYKCV
jgi:hypothetical protein